MKYLIIALLFFSSCKDNKNTSKNDSSLHTISKRIRPDVIIKNQLFHLKINGRNNPEKHVNVLGQYVTDRFEMSKNSVFLDGISDVIEVDNHPKINPKKALTISIWYQPDSYKGVGQNSIVWKGFDEYKAPYCQYLLSAIGNLYPSTPAVFKFGLSINGEFNQIQSLPNTWKPNLWYHITGTYDGEKMKLYINGKLVNQRVIKGELDLYDTPLLIGKTPLKEFYTSGIYDDFRLFDRPLTPEEITILYQER